jgi:GntR family transcriptional regulator
MNKLRKPLPDTAVPLYVALADQLRQQIDRGVWSTGDSLPSLHQIAESFGVARLTARQAVQRLVSEGLLSSGRGQGTVVTEAATQVKTAPLESSLVELGQTYRDLIPLILEIDESPRTLPELEGVEEGYVYMRRLHKRGSRPYCVISLYIATSIFSLAPADFRNKAVIGVLLDRSDLEIAQAHQVLTIETADAENAALLQIPTNAPTARVNRVFRDADGGIMYYAEVIYRGDAIRLEIDLKS